MSYSVRMFALLACMVVPGIGHTEPPQSKVSILTFERSPVDVGSLNSGEFTFVPPSLQLVSKEAKPILNVKSLFLDDDGHINVKIRNDGGKSVPPEIGVYSLFVNGQLVEKKPLSSIGGQEFRYPGGMSILKTGVRLHGNQQRVGFQIDPDKQIDQTMRYFNIRTQMFTPPRRTGVDLVLESLIPTNPRINNRSGLGIEVSNQGTSPLTAGSRALIRVRLDDNNLLHEAWYTFARTLRVGEKTTIQPAVIVPVSGHLTVDVDLALEEKDLDTTNNHIERKLIVDLTPYENFLAKFDDPSSPVTMIPFYWDDGDGILNQYSQWTASQKRDLLSAIVRREMGQGPPLIEPPEVVDILTTSRATVISTENAWNIYLAFVAQSLWVEINKKVPWSLLDQDPRHIKTFSSGTYFVCRPEFNGCAFNPLFSQGISYIAPWNPLPEYEFLENFGMIGDTHEETIYAFTEWMRGRLSHFKLYMINADDDRETLEFAQYNYKGISPPPERILYPLEGRAVESFGCTTTSGLYACTLGTVNIPVEVTSTSLDWYVDSIESGGHTRPLFWSLGKTLGHGDEPYSRLSRPIYNGIPIEDLFFDFDPQYFPPNSWETPAINDVDVLAHGQLDCVNGKCNTKTEQLTYLYGKEMRKRNLEGLGGYLLSSYIDGTPAVDTPSELNDILTGPFVKPYFSLREQAQIRRQLERQLLEIGDGDRQKGVARVRGRSKFFWDNIN